MHSMSNFPSLTPKILGLKQSGISWLIPWANTERGEILLEFLNKLIGGESWSNLINIFIIGLSKHPENLFHTITLLSLIPYIKCTGNLLLIVRRLVWMVLIVVSGSGIINRIFTYSRGWTCIGRFVHLQNPFLVLDLSLSCIFNMLVIDTLFPLWWDWF